MEKDSSGDERQTEKHGGLRLGKPVGFITHLYPQKQGENQEEDTIYS